MLSTNRKYFTQELLACETRDISPRGKNRDKRGYSAGNLLLFPAPFATIFFYQKARSIEPIHRKRGDGAENGMLLFSHYRAGKGIVMKARVKSGD
ncbi:hypothetical protein LNQ52_29175 [Klebsiella pneumoniae subsp. pneumoniae]|nr:hypothetical protein [Klebsiella pneumoniae subsp. pneumoniae]